MDLFNKLSKANATSFAQAVLEVIIGEHGMEYSGTADFKSALVDIRKKLELASIKTPPKITNLDDLKDFMNHRVKTMMENVIGLKMALNLNHAQAQEESQALYVDLYQLYQDLDYYGRSFNVQILLTEVNRLEFFLDFVTRYGFFSALFGAILIGPLYPQQIRRKIGARSSKNGVAVQKQISYNCLFSCEPY
ncbi:MAG: hypothetical protein HY843_02460 [Bdellovibrio sp.]|nr:hypothetical protein [Bdellovibrio sp.]